MSVVTTLWRTGGRGRDRWSWSKCGVPEGGGLGQGAGEGHSQHGAQENKGISWAHGFKLQQEAIRKNN